MTCRFCYATIAVAFLIVSALLGGVVKIVHASEVGAPSPVASGIQRSQNRRFEAVPEDTPGAVVDRFDDGPPMRPAGRSGMEGEWYGLDVNQRMLVTLIVKTENEPTRLAVAQKTGVSVQTTIYEFDDLVVNDHEFVVGGPSSAVQLKGSTTRLWHSGSGRATLTLSDKRQTTELYLFRGESGWLDQRLSRARVHGLL